MKIGWLLLLFFLGDLASGQETASSKWSQLPVEWSDTTNQIRSMVVSQNQLFVGVGGMSRNCAQVWKLTDSHWSRFAELESYKVAALQADAEGNLYLGAGTPHSAETLGKGQAEVWQVDRQGNKTRLLALPERDVIYSAVWFQDKLHVGTMTEDRPGTAEIWRFDDPGWTLIAGAGVPGWPQKNSYAGAYELWVHENALIAGTFSRTMGEGDILRWQDGRWVDLNAPETTIALSFVTYQGQLIAALSNTQSQHQNPIFRLELDGAWKPLGTAPAEWKPAHIFNHLVIHNGEMYLGVGGKRGTLSVWKYDGTNWKKLGGDGRDDSWTSPIVQRGHEWVYRMAIHDQRLFAGFASDTVPFPAPVWKLPLP